MKIAKTLEKNWMAQKKNLNEEKPVYKIMNNVLKCADTRKNGTNIIRLSFSYFITVPKSAEDGIFFFTFV